MSRRSKKILSGSIAAHVERTYLSDRLCCRHKTHFSVGHHRQHFVSTCSQVKHLLLSLIYLWSHQRAIALNNLYYFHEFWFAFICQFASLNSPSWCCSSRVMLSDRIYTKECHMAHRVLTVATPVAIPSERTYNKGCHTEHRTPSATTTLVLDTVTKASLGLSRLLWIRTAKSKWYGDTVLLRINFRCRSNHLGCIICDDSVISSGIRAYPYLLSRPAVRFFAAQTQKRPSAQYSNAVLLERHVAIWNVKSAL